jgi:hypothetical protein
MKKIDTIKMVRDIRDKQFDRTKKMTRGQMINYYREKALLFKRQIEKSIPT